jgi:uncharacterized membrane protein YphA (DoxX/SURF4 family)
MFPPGAPGVGLLLLRISVAATFVLSVTQSTRVSAVHVLFVGALLISISLAIGFLTPYLSFVICALALLNVYGPDWRTDSLTLTCLVLNPLALALLGPGAYSLDARLFGRRVVVVLPRKGTDR